MKYFIFIPHMNIGGVERSFLTLSNQLLEKGNNVSIITLNQSKNLLNYDNKIIGLGVIYNGMQGYLPCYPSSMLNDIDIKFVDEVDWRNYDTTIQFLTEMKKVKKEILCNPINKIEEDGLVVGILTETNQFIEINPPEENKDPDYPTILHSNHIITDLIRFFRHFSYNSRIAFVQ